MSNGKELIKTIEAALSDNASEDARREAAAVCRQLLSVLETNPGQQLAPVVPLHVAPEPAAPSLPPQPVPAGLNPTLMLDALIARLKSELPKDEQPERAEPELRIPFVPIPGSGAGQ